MVWHPLSHQLYVLLHMLLTGYSLANLGFHMIFIKLWHYAQFSLIFAHFAVVKYVVQAHWVPLSILGSSYTLHIW
jgi:hypothetical protein